MKIQFSIIYQEASYIYIVMGNAKNKAFGVKKKDLYAPIIPTEIELGIVGCYNFNDYEKFCHVMDVFIKENCKSRSIGSVIRSNSFGTDYLIEKYCAENKIKEMVYTMDWKKYSSDSQIAMNKKIIDRCNFLLIFQSESSRDICRRCIKAAYKRGINVMLFDVSIKQFR